MNQTKELLIKSKEVIKDEDNWCTGDTYQNADGSPLSRFEIKYVDKCCAYGATGVAAISMDLDADYHLGEDSVYKKMGELLRSAAQSLGFSTVVNLNDNSNHANVLKMFDIAIKNAG